MNTPEDLARRARHHGQNSPGYIGSEVVSTNPTVLRHTFASNLDAERFCSECQLGNRKCWIDDSEPNAVYEQIG